VLSSTPLGGTRFISIVEAMAVGTPVILSSECALADDLVASDAALVSSETTRISEALNGDMGWETIGSNGRHWVHSKCSPNIVGHELAVVYSSVADCGMR
jgi:glycosyltransferase involved in cell wall biosynthesis